MNSPAMELANACGLAPKTKVVIRNYEPELSDLRDFKTNVKKLLFDDLGLPKGVQHSDQDIYDCIEGLRNLQTGFDEYDPEDGEYVKHHPSYKELTEFKQESEKAFASTTKTLEYRAKQNKQLSIQLACLKAENVKLKETNGKRFDEIKEMEKEVGVSKLVHHQNLELVKDNARLTFQVDALDKQATELCLKNNELKEEIKTYKETLDEHFHHYDLLKEKKNKEIEELKANFQVVWEVLGESSYADELNKRLFPENFEED